jgi:hypothetical protein
VWPHSSVRKVRGGRRRGGERFEGVARGGAEGPTAKNRAPHPGVGRTAAPRALNGRYLTWQRRVRVGVGVSQGCSCESRHGSAAAGHPLRGHARMAAPVGGANTVFPEVLVSAAFVSPVVDAIGHSTSRRPRDDGREATGSLILDDDGGCFRWQRARNDICFDTSDVREYVKAHVRPRDRAVGRPSACVPMRVDPFDPFCASRFI